MGNKQTSYEIPQMIHVNKERIQIKSHAFLLTKSTHFFFSFSSFFFHFALAFSNAFVLFCFFFSFCFCFLFFFTNGKYLNATNQHITNKIPHTCFQKPIPKTIPKPLSSLKSKTKIWFFIFKACNEL